jgi:sulfite dehydrogenase (cytochrome) subunit B
MNLFRLLAPVALIAVSGVANADEFAIKLKPGAGVETVQNNCAACHSLDYIQTNSPYLNATGWNAEVTKMISVFGASISEGDAKTIAEYLTKSYGG